MLTALLSIFLFYQTLSRESCMFTAVCVLSQLHPAPLVIWAPAPCQQRAGCSCHGAHHWWLGAATTSHTAWCARSATRGSASPAGRRSASNRAPPTCRNQRLWSLTWTLILTTPLLWRLAAACPSSAARRPWRASPQHWTTLVSPGDRCSLSSDILSSIVSLARLKTRGLHRGICSHPPSPQGCDLLSLRCDQSLTVIFLSISHQRSDPPKVTVIHLDDRSATSLTLSWTLSRRPAAHINHRYELMYRRKVSRRFMLLWFSSPSPQLRPKLVWWRR